MNSVRRSGRTTKQIQSAKLNSTFFCHKNSEIYVKKLCKFLGRIDLKVVGISSKEQLVQKSCGRRDFEIDHYLWKYFNEDKQEFSQAWLDFLNKSIT